MRRAAVRCALVIASVAAGACGARSELEVPTRDPRASDAALDARDAAVAPPDVMVTPCVWTVAEPVAITAPDRDRAPETVRLVNDRLWIGYQSSNPDPPGNQGHFVRVTDASGAPLAPAVEIVPSPPQLTGYRVLTLVADVAAGRYAGMAWDAAAGCRIVPLDDNARPRGAALTVMSEQCVNLAGTLTGWSFLDGTPGAAETRVVHVDAAGRRLDQRALAVDTTRATPTRITFADSSFLLVAITDDGTTSHLTLRHFDEAGAALAPAVVSSPAAPNAAFARFSAWDEGEGLLVAWSEVERGGRRATARVARLDRDGRTVVGPVEAASSEQGFYALSVARRGDAVVLAYNPFSNDMPGALDARFLRADTLAAGATLAVHAARFPSAIAVRPTSAGFVVAYGALATGLTQVWTALVACGR